MLKNDTERDSFIENNLGLVHSICKRFCGRGIEYEDLYQAGCMGLVKAHDAFNKDLGLCFSTYAVPVIMGEVRRLFRDGGAVKVSRSLKELSIRINYQREKLEQELNREPTIAEIAKSLDITSEEVTEAVCATQGTVSLTFEAEDGINEIDLPTQSLEEEIGNKLILDEAFKILSENEKQLMVYRYYKGFTQSKTAQILNLTQVQVSRTEKRILEKLRRFLSAG